MHNLPRQKLSEIIRQYGYSISEDPKKCEALLRDFCGGYRKEIAVLISALKDRVPAELLASQNSGLPTVKISRLIKGLEENHGLTKAAAKWSVESWALALGVISNEEATRETSQDQNRVRGSGLDSSPPPRKARYPKQPMDYVPRTEIDSSVNNTVETKIKYAGFWTRFIAALLDGIILYILGAIIGFLAGTIVGTIYGIIVGSAYGVEEVMQPIALILGILITWVYFAVLESSPKQATLGKQAMKIMVVDTNGNRISSGKAWTRAFFRGISGLILGIGFIMAAFTEKKQTLHDILAGTLVVEK